MRGQKAALVIRLFYEEERQKAELRKQATQFGGTVSPDLGYPTTGKVAEKLAKKAGIGRSSMEYLIAVYRNRPDLFELVFDGSYSASSSSINVSNSFISTSSTSHIRPIVLR